MRKFTGKLLSMVIGAFIVSASFSGVASASAPMDNKEFSITIKQGVYKATTPSMPTYSVSNYNEFYKALDSSIKNVDSSVKMVFKNSYLKGNLQGFRSNFEKIISFVGTGSYVESYSAYQYTEDGNEVYVIYYNYHMSIDEVKRKTSQVNSLVASITSKIVTSSMSDYQKEKAIHDYIVNTARYDVENLDKDTIPIDSHTPYGILVNKVAVCDGYATTMKKMLDAVGVDSQIVVGTGDGVPHAWNLVKINSIWYHVDPTWDDPISYLNGQLKPILSYDFFNKTDSYMARTHYWIKENYPKADLSKYQPKKGTRFMPSRYIVKSINK
ncbi:transglutaminase domain-containing protein [Clostridium cylindrosporum]|uniref:Transglutaminase domain-containing protein n=1 Tax=Clostridium cylindrosporum DSM 605 TaxID=1121307 RepID=A0A0J8DAJ8_CLOCY|nr:transglutaminase domain-containing protein [Clostridium cylindrosporum]KMT22872.1 transglutaminase domain-containing protein [Clostridium cylindrosporum DSM 605]